MNYYTMLGEARELAQWSAEQEALSVYQALKQVADPRRAQGKRYSLALVLTCVLLAKMAGETTRQAITEWVRLRSDWLRACVPGKSSPVSVCGHLQQDLAPHRSCPGQSRPDGVVDTGESGLTQERRPGACGLGWENVTRDTRAFGRGSAENASSQPLRGQDRHRPQSTDGRRKSGRVDASERRSDPNAAQRANHQC
jgi:hypothetical protein